MSADAGSFRSGGGRGELLLATCHQNDGGSSPDEGFGVPGLIHLPSHGRDGDDDRVLFLAFLGSCVLLAMIPGVSTAVIVRQTLREGRASGLAATLGNETGIFLWAMAAVFGLSALVLASEAAYGILKIVGAGVLVVMGVQSIWHARRDSPPAGPGKPGHPGSDSGDGIVGGFAGSTRTGWRRAYGLGLATCGANPKAAVFAMSFLPQFVPPGAHVPVTLTLLAAVWVLVDLVWYVSLIWLVSRARTVFSRSLARRRLEQISGAVLIGLGVRLAVEAR
ncbi:LysE family translocator [Acrocarpospora macrocephala]|uniref:Lysine transporter LysE n=1 Tax=Acrocarpospora macrocephala TaxID=150177 RepID=A0A5M3WMP7_9ACTN|nr:LysE family translocator [Acrocarpospora macrocephala]GES10557.1 lysine transporter LysE [Acrocarpospora macrocephala]